MENDIRAALDELMAAVGERGLSGPWESENDLTKHTSSELDSIADREIRDWPKKLDEWSERSDPFMVLMCIWRESWALWERCLAYRTLRVVVLASAKFAQQYPQAAAGRPLTEEDRNALNVIGGGMRLLRADAQVYRQVNLSSAHDLCRAAHEAAEWADEIQDEMKGALAPPAPGSEFAVESLQKIGDTAGNARHLYHLIGLAAEVLIDFESWLATAPRLGADEPGADEARQSAADAARRTVLDKLETALGRLHQAQDPISNPGILSESEPWGQLLTEIKGIVSPGDAAAGAKVFVPARLSIRYCYPFAVVGDDEKSLQSDQDLRMSLQETFDRTFGADQIRASLPRPLEPTEFFGALNARTRIYGGKRVDLPDINICHGNSLSADDGVYERCKVWLDLSRMGNHCLCIEPVDELQNPLPHLLYRTLRAGTPFVIGATVALVPGAPEPARDSHQRNATWDNLHLFGRDIIRATATASFWKDSEKYGKIEDGTQFVRGNLHEVVIARTNSPQQADVEASENALDHAVGGRILMRSIQRAATTSGEWIRYPPGRTDNKGHTQVLASVAELGMGGDWLTHTGETTIFGISAAPQWHSDVYVEAAQFANSWSPRLRMWSRRLEDVTAGDPQSKNYAQLRDDSARLRSVDLGVRRHLVQIRSEELCGTLAHRRFLDQLLTATGLDRLQLQLEAQLSSAERTADWFVTQMEYSAEQEQRKAEQEQRKADARRDKLLFFIALFGLFELGGFLTIADTTGFFYIGKHHGAWQDWLMLGVFITGLLAGIYYFFVRDRRDRAGGNRLRMPLLCVTQRGSVICAAPIPLSSRLSTARFWNRRSPRTSSTRLISSSTG